MRIILTFPRQGSQDDFEWGRDRGEYALGECPQESIRYRGKG